MKYMKYNIHDNISFPTLILSTKWHHHLGVIHNVGRNINVEFNMSSHQEISFDVYKELDGVKCDLWDDIVDFKYVYVPEHDIYYEITVSISDSNKTVKHCVGVSAGECELSQRYLRDFHINDETDILMDDYVITVFYNPSNPKGSLLHRTLHDKCPDWSIAHVDSTIASIQRTFNVNDSSVYDFLTKTVAEEIGCLFLFDSVRKQISAYDLRNKCNNCGFRGEFIDRCPKCDSLDFTPGYGEWQNVYVSPDNITLEIDVQGDTDSVKNCFRVEGGDDLITATVANLNPNRSNYIYRFSEAMRADMPTELVTALDNYDELYNRLLAEYQQYTEDYYEAVDDQLYYQTSMMPETPIPEDTTAQEQLDILMGMDFTVAVQNISSVSQASADLAVEGYARVLVDPRYTVEVSNTTLEPYIGVKKWSGYFTVKSLGGVNEQGDPDEATSEEPKEIIINDDYEAFLKQKIDKALARGEATFTTIFNIEDDEDFKEALTKYALDSLSSFYNSYQSVLEILIQQGVSDQYATFYDVQLYESLYLPNYTRQGWIADEMVVREGQVQECLDRMDEANEHRDEIQEQLNLRNYLGEELYEIFILYLREDTYTNGNYISDGLDNVAVIDKASELLKVAEDELHKASEIQVSLSGNLTNFLNTEEFINFKSRFEIGDWIICKADDKLYKLRLINLSYTYDDPTNLSVSFSNVARTQNYASDINDILSKATSMASSYAYITHQASQGNRANRVLDGFLEDGVDTSAFKINAGDLENIIIDEHGITAKSYDDTLKGYSPEQMKITHNALVFTKDNWETATLGLGKQEYSKYDATEDGFVTIEDYGLSARFVQAGYIQGSDIVAGNIYSTNYSSSNHTGAHINLNDGTFTLADGKLTFDGTDFSINGGNLIVRDTSNNILFKADIDNHLVNIGGFTVENNAIYNGTDSILSTTSGVYLGTDGIRNYYDATHYVDIKNGTLTANSVNVSGDITASTLTANNGGVIAGWSINDSKIYAGDATSKVAVMQRPDATIVNPDDYFVFAAGGTSHDNYSNCNFRVTQSGKCYAEELYFRENLWMHSIYDTEIYHTIIEETVYDAEHGYPEGNGAHFLDYLPPYRTGQELNALRIFAYDPQLGLSGILYGDWMVSGSLVVTGTKPRMVETKDYGNRLLYCYETASPMFGDVGDGQISEDGKCYIWLDPIFAQTISTYGYQVFLQKCGDGDCWIAEKTPNYFVVQGTPSLEFSWELKAKQSDYDQRRLEQQGLYRKHKSTNYGELGLNIIRNEREVEG